MSKIKLCDICWEKDLEYIKEKINDIAPDKELEIGCMGYCSLGNKKKIIIVDTMPIIVDTKEEIIEKLKEKIK